jgi:hypothetical protein
MSRSVSRTTNVVRRTQKSRFEEDNKDLVITVKRKPMRRRAVYHMVDPENEDRIVYQSKCGNCTRCGVNLSIWGQKEGYTTGCKANGTNGLTCPVPCINRKKFEKFLHLLNDEIE